LSHSLVTFISNMERVPTQPMAVPAPKKGKKKRDLKLTMPPNILVEPPQQSELEQAIADIQPVAVEIFGTLPAPPPLSPTQEFLQHLERLDKLTEKPEQNPPEYEVMEEKPSVCPFHSQETLSESHDYYYYCPFVGCPVFCNKDTKQIVLPKLEHETSPDLRCRWDLLFLRIQTWDEIKQKHHEF